MIRVQCNANHTDLAIDGLIGAFAKLKQLILLPRREERNPQGGFAKLEMLEKVQTFYAKRFAG